MEQRVCPYVESVFEILGKKWSAQIIHYINSCENHTAHFSDLKRDLEGITPRALSIRLTELTKEELMTKYISDKRLVTYTLTEKGQSLAQSFAPLQSWAKRYSKGEL